MSDYLELILLGLVQGLAEFLPISSSGHLVLTKSLWSHFSGEPPIAGNSIEVLLHLGTLAAIFLVYWKELWELRTNPRLCGLLILATLPAACVGLTLKDWFDEAFNSSLIVGFGLLMTATLLVIGQKVQRGQFTERTLAWPGLLLVGCFQALALVPGISRSGSTIVGGLMLGMERVAATRLSFLLAVPVTGGAILISAKDWWEQPTTEVSIGPLAVGTFVAFVVGYVALLGLIRMVSRAGLHWFAGYCAAVGCLTIAASLWLPTAPVSHITQTASGPAAVR